MTYNPVLPIPSGSNVYSEQAGTISIAPVQQFGAAPSSTTVNYNVGQIAYVPSTNSVYMLTSKSASAGTVSANWTLIASNGGDVVAVNGTSNEITATTSGGTVTLSIPSTFNAPGSITAATTLTATSGAITATNGNLVLSAAGNKLLIHATTAASDSVGTTGAMSGTPGAVSVSTTACTTSSIILFSRATTGGTPGQVSITAQSAGSFTLTSTSNETSTFNYLIIN